MMQKPTTAHIDDRELIIECFPFDIVQMTGSDSVDFLQRITTNDFGSFKPGSIQKTLIITEKGRVIDAVWVIHRGQELLMVCSNGMADEIIAWLNRFIIMEDITLANVSRRYTIDLLLGGESAGSLSDYFGVPMRLKISESTDNDTRRVDHSFESWRIRQGIPMSKKELSPEYNPLELNLWDWISFQKGCYIGQEVIARLDTYQKVQRALCLVSFSDAVSAGDIVVDSDQNQIGKVTSSHDGIGLAVLRSAFAHQYTTLRTAGNSGIRIEKVFRKEVHGRN